MNAVKVAASVHEKAMLAAMDCAADELRDALNDADQCGAWDVPAHRRDADQDEAVIRVQEAQEALEEQLEMGGPVMEVFERAVDSLRETSREVDDLEAFGLSDPDADDLLDEAEARFIDARSRVEAILARMLFDRGVYADVELHGVSAGGVE